MSFEDNDTVNSANDEIADDNVTNNEAMDDKLTGDKVTDDKSEDSRQENEFFYREFSLGDFEVTFNFKRMKSPIEILEKLQQIHENESLTNDEKNKHIQKIMSKFME